MVKTSLSEAKNKYLGRKYSKDLSIEINGAGFTFSVSRSTGTIAEIRADGFPKESQVKRLEQMS